MFGFILPNLESLDDQEKERYKAVYCGVCRSIRARYGQISRLTVSYDMTFLALVLGSLYESAEQEDSKRCPVHPTRPQDFARSEFTDYAADLSVALAYHKCLDDWRDDRSVRARAAAAALSGPYRRARTRIPDQCRAIEQAMDDIHAIEQAALAASAPAEAGAQPAPAANASPAPATSPADAGAQPAPAPAISPAPGATLATPQPAPSPDAAANRFGLLLGDLFALKDDFWSTELRRFGARLGKFVYVMDAAMDLGEDLSTGSYNPFSHQDLTPDEMRETLEMLAAGTADAFERLPLERDVHVLRSVLYAGVWQRYEAKESKEHHG